MVTAGSLLNDSGLAGLAGGAVHFSGAPPAIVGDGLVEGAADGAAEGAAVSAGAVALGAAPALSDLLSELASWMPTTAPTMARTATTTEPIIIRWRALACWAARRSSWRW